MAGGSCGIGNHGFALSLQGPIPSVARWATAAVPMSLMLLVGETLKFRDDLKQVEILGDAVDGRNPQQPHGMYKTLYIG